MAAPTWPWPRGSRNAARGEGRVGARRGAGVVAVPIWHARYSPPLAGTGYTLGEKKLQGSLSAGPVCPPRAWRGVPPPRRGASGAAPRSGGRLRESGGRASGRAVAPRARGFPRAAALIHYEAVTAVGKRGVCWTRATSLRRIVRPGVTRWWCNAVPPAVMEHTEMAVGNNVSSGPTAARWGAGILGIALHLPARPCCYSK